MPAQPLILFPDPRLRLRSEPVDSFDAGLRALVRDVSDTLDAVAAAGLTAAHLGTLLRVVVLRPEPGAPATTYVNPVLTWQSEARVAGREGSVSMPGVSEEVERAGHLRLRFQDAAGVAHEAEAEGFQAACLLHEIDQLDGVFWIERLSRLRRERVLKRYAKLRQIARAETGA